MVWRFSTRTSATSSFSSAFRVAGMPMGHDLSDLALQLVQQSGIKRSCVRGGQLVLQLRFAGLALGHLV
jgi:alkyl hydroperoxide reductase subunit AhpF